MKFTAEDIERNFRGVAGIRAYSKKPEHAGDAGYWTGGRCEYGAAHNLKEDCQRLASFFAKITELKNSKSKVAKFESQEEFEKNKQELIGQCQEAINGLQVRTGPSTSIGGVCSIWAYYTDHLDGLISVFRRSLESLSEEINRIPYSAALKLRKLKAEEKNLKRTIEENLKKANLEKDPEKKKKLLILVDEDNKKLRENYKEQKKVRIGEDFDPDKNIEEFIEGIKNKLASKNRPPKSHTNPSTPNNNPSLGEQNSNPLSPFQPTNQTPLQPNQPLILIAIITLLLIYYFFSQEEKTLDYNY